MTSEELDALAALVEKATPGPVHLRQPWIIQWPTHDCGEDAPNCDAEARVLLGHTQDADLIAALLNAAPALIAAARELLKERDKVARLVRAGDGLMHEAQHHTDGCPDVPRWAADWTAAKADQ